IVPVFDAIDPLCLDANAPVLPLTSNNGITGKWDPAVVSTDAVGTTTYTFTPDEGQCAGPVTLEVTVNDVLTSTTSETICINQLPYIWNGNSYTAAGTYNITLTSTGGCDSIATLILTVNDVLTSTTEETI